MYLYIFIVIRFLYLVNVYTKEWRSVDYYAIILSISSLLLFHVGDIKAVFKTEGKVHTIKTIMVLILQETLAKAKQIFGPDNQDLYYAFDGLITRHVT